MVLLCYERKATERKDLNDMGYTMYAYDNYFPVKFARIV